MRFSTILTLMLSLAMSLAPWTIYAQTGSQIGGDDALADINQAFKKGDRKRVAAMLPQVVGHPLEAWAVYWNLKLRLDSVTAQEVQDFFARFPGSYQEDRLRADWLLLLGQKRDWAAFAAGYPSYRMGDDKELRCYAMAANEAVADVVAFKSLWYSLRDVDDGCTYLADRLFAAKKISETDLWRKARLAIEANRPRVARAAVEIISPEAASQVSELHDNPARYQNKRAAAILRHTPELAVLALVRMAANDPDAAAGALENHWGVRLTPEQRSWAWGAIGKGAAQRLSSDASAYFSKTGDADLPDDYLAWKARAALRKGDWRDVMSATAAMSGEGKADPAWMFWRAKAQIQLARSQGEELEAKAVLQTMASPRGFYEQLALEELGQRITLPARPPAPTLEEKGAARKNPGLLRALHAIRLGLRQEGVREWNYTTNLHTKGGMGDRELLAAADFACEREVYDRCINSSERTKSLADYEQRYPMPFRDAVLARAKQIELDPAYVYGLIRQESRFIMDARSGVGASGLMQVMPATARWTAKRIGMTDFQPHQITDRDTNIAIGTGYLKLVLDDFSGSMPLAAAAYNAGPSRSRNWRAAGGGPVLDAAIWAENVPFAETRDYVKKVLANTTVYAALITGKPQSLKSRLGTIGPRDAAAPAPNAELP
jgi:soluble lytic murein transglycosylase